MPKKKPPLPTTSSLTIRKLAAHLKQTGKVWIGRGRKPANETRPTLIEELCRVSGRGRNVIHRALAGANRAGRESRIGQRAELRRLNVSSNVSVGTPPPPRVGSGVINILPSTSSQSLSISRDMRRSASLPPAASTLQHEVQGPTPNAATESISRDLAAVGLRAITPAPAVVPPAPSVVKDARCALQDGIDWYLQVGNPNLDLKRRLTEIANLLASLPLR